MSTKINQIFVKLIRLYGLVKIEEKTQKLNCYLKNDKDSVENENNGKRTVTQSSTVLGLLLS